MIITEHIFINMIRYLQKTRNKENKFKSSILLLKYFLFDNSKSVAKFRVVYDVLNTSI